MIRGKICVLKSRRYPENEDDLIDGGSLNVWKIVHELTIRDYSVDVFTRHEGTSPLYYSRGAVNIFRIPFIESKNPNLLMRDYEEGLSFVEGVINSRHFTPKEYLSIHTHHWTSGIGLTVALPASSRLVHTPHLLALEKANHNGIPCPQVVVEAEKQLFGRAVNILSLSKSETGALINSYGVSHTKIVETPNGVDREFFNIRTRSLDQNSTFKIVSIGRLCRQKGIDILLDAMEQLLLQQIPVQLTLVGGSYYEQEYESKMIDRASAAPLREKVSVIGQVPHWQIPALLSNCQVYVQASRYESQGIALLEAMASGCTVVATDLAAVREYISSEVNGVLVPSENSEALANALIRIFRDPSFAQTLADAARRRAISFTWDRLLNLTLPVLVGNEYNHNGNTATARN
jgi:D-inositol-3-phosphate glycosyltransferase